MACDSCIAQSEDISGIATELLGRAEEPTTWAHGRSEEEEIQPAFCLQNEINIPLFLVAWRCREPRLRRRLICLLEARCAREGLWDDCLFAAIAKRIDQVEEHGLDLSVESCGFLGNVRVDSLSKASSDGDTIRWCRVANKRIPWEEGILVQNDNIDLIQSIF